MKCQKNKELTLDDAYKYLDRDRFHLSLEVRWNGLIPYRLFYLFRNYPNGDPIYYSDDNKVILSGDDRNKDDVEKLVEYLKNHQKIDTVKNEKTLSIGYEDLKRIRGILQGNEFDLRMFEEYLQKLKGVDKDG